MGRNLKDDAMTALDREPPKQEGRLPLAFPETRRFPPPTGAIACG